MSLKRAPTLNLNVCTPLNTWVRLTSLANDRILLQLDRKRPGESDAERPVSHPDERPEESDARGERTGGKGESGTASQGYSLLQPCYPTLN